MFSALKFIAASAIVALFGGFLTMGLLNTQQAEEAMTIAASASPTTEATSEATSAPTDAETESTRTDILPGVKLTVEQVEPGVFRVLHDGARAGFVGDIVAGHDGSILLVRGGDERQRGSFIRLGSKGSRRLPQGHTSRVVATPDGTVWVVSWDRRTVPLSTRSRMGRGRGGRIPPVMVRLNSRSRPMGPSGSPTGRMTRRTWDSLSSSGWGLMAGGASARTLSVVT